MEKYSRISSIKRNTKETQIKLDLNLDGTGKSKIDTGVGFFDHMLTLMAFHGKMDLEIQAVGDLYVCDHHLVEDVGISLGEAFSKAIGDKRGIERYGSSRLVMDETLSQVDVDISGRGVSVFNCEFKREKIGEMSTEMIREFFYAFAINAKIGLHINSLYGENDHHIAESIFKAVGRALKDAKKIVSDELPSTKDFLG